MKTRILLIAFSCICLLSAKGQDKNYEKLLKSLDELVPALLKEWNVPGVAIGVVHKDKLVYAKEFGYRDIEKKLPVTPDNRIG